MWRREVGGMTSATTDTLVTHIGHCVQNSRHMRSQQGNNPHDSHISGSAQTQVVLQVNKEVAAWPPMLYGIEQGKYSQPPETRKVHCPSRLLYV